MSRVCIEFRFRTQGQYQTIGEALTATGGSPTGECGNEFHWLLEGKGEPLLGPRQPLPPGDQVVLRLHEWACNYEDYRDDSGDANRGGDGQTVVFRCRNDWCGCGWGDRLQDMLCRTPWTTSRRCMHFSVGGRTLHHNATVMDATLAWAQARGLPRQLCVRSVPGGEPCYRTPTECTLSGRDPIVLAFLTTAERKQQIVIPINAALSPAARERLQKRCAECPPAIAEVCQFRGLHADDDTEDENDEDE